MARSKARRAELDVLVKASRVISAAIALSLNAAGEELTLPELRALNVIAAGGPMNLAAVAEGLGVDPSNASRTCDRLVGKGLAERRDDPVDRRRTILNLTREGRLVLDRLMAHRRAVLEQIVTRLSRDDQELLSRALESFTAAADELSREGRFLSDGDGHLLRWLG